MPASPGRRISNGRSEGTSFRLPVPKARNPFRSSPGLRCHLIPLCVVAAGSFGLFMGIGTTAGAEGPAPARADVLCGGANSLAYRFRPRACDFHDRRDPISSQVGYTLTRRLRWLHWGPRSATASGEIEYPMAGWYRFRVRLSDPRTGCGRMVFTNAKLRVPGRAPGGLKIPLDRCPLTAG
jgi:hypothetical protein